MDRRSRKEIEEDLIYSNGEPRFDFEMLVLELLLDIRDLLEKTYDK